MLDSIKQMIKKQNDMMEAAGLIFEDATGRNLDDEIVLGKYNPFTEAEMETAEDEMEPVEEEGEDVTPEEDEESNEDIADAPIDDPDGEENPEPIESEDIAEEPIDNEGEEPLGAEAPMPLPGSDLPEPDPSQEVDPMANLISADIDLQSNTLRDILPIPPANAAEAIEGDTLDTHVDSGFGDSEPVTSPPAPVEDNIADSSIDEEPIDGSEGDPSDTSDLSLDNEPIEDQPIEEAYDPTDFDKRSKRGSKEMDKIMKNMDKITVRAHDPKITASKGDVDNFEGNDVIKKYISNLNKFSKEFSNDLKTIYSKLQEFKFQYKMGYKNNVKRVMEEYENAVYILWNSLGNLPLDQTKHTSEEMKDKKIAHKSWKQDKQNRSTILKSAKSLARELSRADHADHLDALLKIINNETNPKVVAQRRKEEKKTKKENGSVWNESSEDRIFDDAMFIEAITLAGGGDDTSDQQTDANEDPLTAAGAAADAAGVNVDTNTEATPSEGENAVTSAVRDKVAETDTEDPFGLSDDDISMGSNMNKGATDLFKQLTDVSKKIDDMKANMFNQHMGQ